MLEQVETAPVFVTIRAVADGWAVYMQKKCKGVAPIIWAMSRHRTNELGLAQSRAMDLSSVHDCAVVYG